MSREFIQQHLNILRDLQTESGLFLASAKHVTTGYNKAWLRDNVYISLAFEQVGDWVTVNRVYHAIFNILQKHEHKIVWAIHNKPSEAWQYIHARYDPYTLEELSDPWGNKQNDAIGLILFKVGELEKAGHSVIRNAQDRHTLQLLVEYLTAIQYWRSADNGMWEEHEEVHASSVGACVAGLRSVADAGIANVNPDVIEFGEATLIELLPRESSTKFCDLALLSLIYPLDIVTEFDKETILKNVEYHLVKDRGVIRYRGDRYYNTNDTNWHEEAEWTMGLPWLSIIHAKEPNTANDYLLAALSTLQNGLLPELYYCNSTQANENVPLGWAESLVIVACCKHQELLTGQPFTLVDHI